MLEFLKSPAGHAVAGAVIALLALLIIELNYRLFFKYVLDFIFALIAVILLSPVLCVCTVIAANRADLIFEKTPCMGAKGKVIFVRSFAGINSKIKYLPRLLDILGGKMSFVGIKLMSVDDGALLDDGAMERFNTRPGIFCHLALRVDESVTYEEMFVRDARYCRRRELFTDIFAVIKCIAEAIRGESGCYLGETKDKSYGEVLSERGQITQTDLENARRAGRDAVEEFLKRKSVTQQKYN